MSMRPEDYLFDYLNIGGIEQALEEAQYGQVSEEIDAAVERLLDADAAGELDNSLDFYISCLMAEIGTILYFYETGTLKVNVSIYHRDYVEMCKDYEQWKKDGTFGRRHWMYPAAEDGDEPWETDEDGYVIQDMLMDCFFSALDAFRVPIETYDSCPEEIKKSLCTKVGRTGQMRIEGARIVSDDGIFSCEDPAGRDFELIDADEVRYHLKGFEKNLLTMSFVGPNDERRFFRGSGWIEGYTTPEEREISVTIFPEKRINFFFDPVEGDEAVRENDPRWKDFYSWEKEHLAVNERWKQAILEGRTQ